MTLELMVFWSIVGWCGTPPSPPRPPIPTPQWWVARILGVGGGVVGGWLFDSRWPVESMQGGLGIAVVASGVGALLGSLLVKDIVAPMFVRPEPLPPG